MCPSLLDIITNQQFLFPSILNSTFGLGDDESEGQEEYSKQEKIRENRKQKWGRIGVSKELNTQAFLPPREMRLVFSCHTTICKSI